MKIKFANRIEPEALNNLYSKDLLPGFFGISFTEVGEDYIRATMEVEDRHLRPGGIANGGVYLTLLETLGSMSACCVVDMEKFNALGVQVSANHTGMAMKGDKTTATSKAIHIGRSTHIWEVNIENADGRLLSSGRITMMIVPRK
ncbi:MAG TPA: PaaI family thioesterase [Bacteriovoracaceae bacterium]|nr:PaaI family thioesterase [Bacteriovoracaceae bacterium]